MIKNNSYYNWFKKTISLFIELFFVFAILSTLYVFTYPFEDGLKKYIFVGFIIIFAVVVFLSKDKVKELLNILTKKLECLDYKKMLLIIVMTMIILKVFYSLTCYFDPTNDENDISIYCQIADQILETKSINSNTISHLLGVALHLAFFKLLNIPYHIGIFIVYLLGTIVNFYSFKKIIGKEKAFIAIMLYILMPSTMLLTFCPTHEVFLYLYISLSLFFINKIIDSNNNKQIVLLSTFTIICVILACFVNPAGNLILIIIGLLVLLSSIKNNKKILFIIILVLSLLSSNLITKALNIDNETTQINTYSILICGSSIETNGEHVDHYPSSQARAYLKNLGISYDYSLKLSTYKIVLMNQYKYLFTHPIDLIKLLAHKFYIEWSGDHYSIEMAHTHNGVSDYTYYILLALSAMLYLLVLTIGFIYRKDKDDYIYLTNYKLLLLGVVALLLITLVLNKYSIYATIFIYLISFSRINIRND